MEGAFAEEAAGAMRICWHVAVRTKRYCIHQISRNCSIAPSDITIRRYRLHTTAPSHLGCPRNNEFLHRERKMRFAEALNKYHNKSNELANTGHRRPTSVDTAHSPNTFLHVEDNKTRLARSSAHA